MITLPTLSNLEELFRHPMPTMYNLPSENPEEPGLPDEFHAFQPILLLLIFHPLNWDPEMVYSVFNHYIYYDANHPLWYKRPDWYGVVGVPRRYQGRDMRSSYAMWQEKISPLIVVELLSPGTEDEDLGRTKSTGGHHLIRQLI
ncbi:MAG: Uma2 family endonuclease [Hormoscilla sp. SP5CHS1]|nr:Uma2 family endonuclease [Hormoscilla sp. SP12CHS1]MBC6455109.1 Uma2 family endonuclease [Hormoscilla sp. SP5CHS1]